MPTPVYEVFYKSDDQLRPVLPDFINAIIKELIKAKATHFVNLRDTLSVEKVNSLNGIVLIRFDDQLEIIPCLEYTEGVIVCTQTYDESEKLCISDLLKNNIFF
jgi:hypothetical protein